MRKHFVRVTAGFTAVGAVVAFLLTNDIPTVLRQADKSAAEIARALGFQSPPEHMATFVWQHPGLAFVAFVFVFCAGVALSWLLEAGYFRWKNRKSKASEPDLSDLGVWRGKTFAFHQPQSVFTREFLANGLTNVSTVRFPNVQPKSEVRYSITITPASAARRVNACLSFSEGPLPDPKNQWYGGTGSVQVNDEREATLLVRLQDETIPVICRVYCEAYTIDSTVLMDIDHISVPKVAANGAALVRAEATAIARELDGRLEYVSQVLTKNDVAGLRNWVSKIELQRVPFSDLMAICPQELSAEQLEGLRCGIRALDELDRSITLIARSRRRHAHIAGLYKQRATKARVMIGNLLRSFERQV